jgi:hypothetical protein
MTSAQGGFGTLLKVGDGGTPETFTTIAEVLDLDGPEIMQDTEEVTNQSSPDGHKERIPTGINDTGPITFQVNWIVQGATHNATTGVAAMARDGQTHNFQLVWPDAAHTTWSGPGVVKSFKPGAPVNGVLRGDVTIEPSGKWTLA